MKVLKRAVCIALSSALILPCAMTARADGEISVRMKGIVSNGTDYVEFGDVAPFQVDNRTLTPARYMAEGAGMEVEWDQPSQTAILTLRVDENSDKPRTLCG